MSLWIKVHIEKSVGSRWQRRCENHVPRHRNKLLNGGKKSSGLRAWETASICVVASVTPAEVGIDPGEHFAKD
jgi:hypothetical protein